MKNAAGTHYIIFALFFALSALFIPSSAFAANADVTVHMQPYCLERGSGGNCPLYAIYDLETHITNGLNVGETLDIEILVKNPSGQPIQSVQSWLKYDPGVLKGMEVRIAEEFPLVAPGEQSFLAGDGIAKIGASNVSGGMRSTEFVFARVKFQILSEAVEPSDLRFHLFSMLGQEGKTKVLLIEEGRTMNVLKTMPRNLRLYFGDDPPPTLILPPAQPPVQVQPPSQGGVPSIIPDDGFSRLQPQGLRVTTDGDRVYLLWAGVNDPRIAGYGIYYGTVSGRYIQRRTVSSASKGVTIRGLPVGQRYFFAMTAYSSLGQESEFGYEVAVVVGSSETSTAPFTLMLEGEREGRGQGLGQGGEDVLGTVSSEDEDILQEGDEVFLGSVIGSGRGRGEGSLPVRQAGTGMPLFVTIVSILIAAFSAFLFKRHRSLP